MDGRAPQNQAGYFYATLTNVGNFSNSTEPILADITTTLRVDTTGLVNNITCEVTTVTIYHSISASLYIAGCHACSQYY